MATLTSSDLTGRKKAALLLIALGVDCSSAVLKELRDHEIEQLALEVMAADNVPDKLQRDVVAECYQMALANQYLTAGGFSYAERLLALALGEDQAVEIIDRLAAGLRPSQFDFLDGTDAFQLA